MILQAAQLNQFPQSDDKSWYVRSSDGQEELGKLPAELNAKQAMSYLHFARPFEKRAFEEGVAHGEKMASITSDTKIQSMQEQLDWLAEQNERLSASLEKMIIGNEE